jgi:hypothetical protein
LFFEEKIGRFSKGFEIKKVYTDYKKSSEEEIYNAFRSKPFGLRLCIVVNKMTTTKNETHYIYYLIKEWVKNKTYSVEIEADLDDINC